MKTRNLIVLVLSLIMFSNCYAQKDTKKDKKIKKGENTEVTAQPDAIPTVSVEVLIVTE